MSNKDRDELRRLAQQRAEQERAQRERDRKMDEAFDKDAKELFGVSPKESRHAMNREIASNRKNVDKKYQNKNSSGCVVVGLLLLSIPASVIYSVIEFLN